MKTRITMLLMSLLLAGLAQAQTNETIPPDPFWPLAYRLPEELQPRKPTKGPPSKPARARGNGF